MVRKYKLCQLFITLSYVQMIGLTSIPTKRSDSSSSTGSITDWDSGHATVHRRSDYLSRKQLQLSVDKSSLDSTA
jgi:hypothetical protein